MVKYKALYKYDMDCLFIYFKCKSNEECITLFLLGYKNESIDIWKPVDIDGITSNFYRVSIYADLPINEDLKVNKGQNLDLIDFDNVLSYESTFVLCRFIKHSIDAFTHILLSPNYFTVTVLINEEYCKNVVDLLLNIITSTLLYWDD